jgi:hypothetical protein
VRNGHTQKVADKVGWPVNWCPTLAALTFSFPPHVQGFASTVDYCSRFPHSFCISISLPPFFRMIYFGSFSSVLKMDISQSTCGSWLTVYLGVPSLPPFITLRGISVSSNLGGFLGISCWDCQVLPSLPPSGGMSVSPNAGGFKGVSDSMSMSHTAYLLHRERGSHASRMR